MHLGANNPCDSYNFNNRTTECVESLRDLGVIVDSGLTFDAHVNNVVSKAYARIAMLFRGFFYTKHYIITPCIQTYVRPILEYASSVWNPHLLKHINALEGVQRHFTKRHLSYEERLACLELDTLECRHLKADLTLIHCTIKSCIILLRGPSIVTLTCLFTLAIFMRLTECRSDFYISAPFCRTLAYQNDFFHRCVSCWNILPSAVTNATFLKLFRNVLARVDLTNHL